MSDFDSYAGNYAEALQAGLSITGESQDYFASARAHWMAKRFHQLAAETSAPRVLDFGCGTGRATHLLFEPLKAAVIFAVDRSSQSIEVAKQINRNQCVQFAQLDSLDSGPITVDNAFDLAHCNGVFHHIPPAQRAEAIAWVYAQLRSEGLFFFWENNPWNPGTRMVMKRIPFDRDAIALSSREARRRLRDGGFNIVKTDYCFYFPAPLAWLRRAEPWLSGVPLGGQYCVVARKP